MACVVLLEGMDESPCGRFVVIERLHIDRAVWARFAAWATERGMPTEAAIQLAICAFTEAAMAPPGRTAVSVPHGTRPEPHGA